MEINQNIFADLQSYGVDELSKLYLYMERYINDGSPSGFDLELPSLYDPLNKNAIVELPIVLDEWTNHLQIGQFPSFPISEKSKVPFLIHPLLVHELPEFDSFNKDAQGSISVQPTASGRTTYWIDNLGEFLVYKIAFSIDLRRFDRSLTMFRWLAALERSKELYIHQNEFPLCLAFLYDCGGTFYQGTPLQFGTIFRETTPRPLRKEKHLLIPSFSLFARRRTAGRTNSVLHDLVTAFNISSLDFLQLFIFPIIDSYIYLTIKLGMIPELNAQNLLFEIDLNCKTSRIVIRDLGDCFIDFEIRKNKGLHTNFCSYKTLDPEKDNDIFKRRSFAYDFKLSTYILKPLVEEYANVVNVSSAFFMSEIKKYYCSKYPDHREYFGGSIWYSYPTEENVNRNSYISNTNPLFR